MHARECTAAWAGQGQGPGKGRKKPKQIMGHEAGYRTDGCFLCLNSTHG
jgi:hypothetical protein